VLRGREEETIEEMKRERAKNSASKSENSESPPAEETWPSLEKKEGGAWAHNLEEEREMTKENPFKRCHLRFLLGEIKGKGGRKGNALEMGKKKKEVLHTEGKEGRWKKISGGETKNEGKTPSSRRGEKRKEGACKTIRKRRFTPEKKTSSSWPFIWLLGETGKETQKNVLGKGGAIEMKTYSIIEIPIAAWEDERPPRPSASVVTNEFLQAGGMIRETDVFWGYHKEKMTAGRGVRAAHGKSVDHRKKREKVPFETDIRNTRDRGTG